MQISGPKNSIVWGPSVYKELKQELLEYKYIDSLIGKKKSNSSHENPIVYSTNYIAWAILLGVHKSWRIFDFFHWTIIKVWRIYFGPYNLLTLINPTNWKWAHSVITENVLSLYSILSCLLLQYSKQTIKSDVFWHCYILPLPLEKM